MSKLRYAGAGPSMGPARVVRGAGALALAMSLAISPVPAWARTAQSFKSAQAEVAAWQRYHGPQTLWVDNGQLRPEAQQLIELVRSARIDGLDPDAYRVRNLEGAVRGAFGGNPKDLAKADFLLSQTLVAVSRDMRNVRGNEMKFADRAAYPTLPSAGLLLDAAAKAPSLSAWLDAMPWMSPAYVALRQAVRAQADPRQAQVLRVNLERARALPGALQGGRYVLVDAAAARLYMIENGEVKDMMRVVVGRPDNPTPMLAGIIRYAILNPYWNVPPDLAATRLAPHVVSDGLSYLTKAHYEVLSDWGDNPKRLNPKTIDWQAVAAGRMPDLRMRQLPGPDNSMGRIKFMFPNDMGIYLHDTDDKSLFAEPARMRSGGCIRLQAANRLAKWLFGKQPTTASKKPEQKVPVPTPVPVYVTYLTAAPENGQIAFRDDIYHRDGGARLLAQTAAR
ncbi:MAG: L,D-transpeptidase family protein [Sphingomicrobium sp.]|nr:L,D-transpeptidase family protein [Sphingomonadales bacterium]